MALAGEVCGGIIGAFACNCVFPHSLQLFALLLGDEFIGDDETLETVIIIAPLYIRNSPVCNAGNGICTALSGGGDHNCGLKEISLCLCEKDKALINGCSFLCGIAICFILAENCFIDLTVIAGNVFGGSNDGGVRSGHGSIGGVLIAIGIGGLCCIGVGSGFFGGTAGNDHAECHYDDNEQSDESLHFLFPP